MGEDVCIRVGTHHDIRAIHRIEQLAFPETPWTLEMITQELSRHTDRKTWILVQGEIIIGYCMVRFGPEKIHLINMAVDPSFQKMGVGQKLLHHFLDNTPENSSVFLEVERGNFPAINLYLDAGFEEVAIREKYYTDDEDAIIMCLKV